METRIYQDNNKKYYIISSIPGGTIDSLIYSLLNSLFNTQVRFIGDECELIEQLIFNDNTIQMDFEQLKVYSFGDSKYIEEYKEQNMSEVIADLLSSNCLFPSLITYSYI